MDKLPWTSERLKIRRLGENDLGALYALLSDPQVMKYLEPPYTCEQTEKFLRQAGLSKNPLIYGVEDKTEKFVGYVIFHGYGGDGMELGWVLSPTEWGKGYAHELTGLLLKQARGKCAYAVIECAPEQEATRHIALKNGFRYVGTEDGCHVYRRELG